MKRALLVGNEVVNLTKLVYADVYSKATQSNNRKSYYCVLRVLYDNGTDQRITIYGNSESEATKNGNQALVDIVNAMNEE